MFSSVHEESRRGFELVTLRREAEHITDRHQWREAAELQARCQKARAREKDLYIKRYDERVETRCNQLIDQMGLLPHEFRPWLALLGLSCPVDILLQARRDVRFAHDLRMTRIDEYESTGLASIVERARRENVLATPEFKDEADRRSGIERSRPRQREP